MDKIDKVFYINLAYRKDRLAEIEQELFEKFNFSKAERFEAIKTERGIVGCTLSHIKIWRMMINNNYNTIMVFEDDATLLTSREEIDRHIEAFLEDPNADILCFGNSCGDQKPYNNLFNRGFNQQTSSCYVLKKQFVFTLLYQYFTDPDRDAFTLDETDSALGEKIGWIDVAWLPLQQTNIFLIPKVRHVVQRESFSDIINKVINYRL